MAVVAEAPPKAAHLFDHDKARAAAQKSWEIRRARAAAAAAQRDAAQPLGGGRPREKGARTGARVQSANPADDTARSTPNQRALIEQFKGVGALNIPPEVQALHPDGAFCWVPNNAQGISKYRSQYRYEIVHTDTPLPGQTDTTVQRGDLILAVRSQEMARLHEQARRELREAQSGDITGRAQGAELEALQEAAQMGARPGDMTFFEEADRITPAMMAAGRPRGATEAADMAQSARRRATLKGAKGRGSKYVRGGLTA